MTYHEPVLLNEVLESLHVENGKKYIDCTLGDGGHTIALLKKGATVMGIDYDPNSLETAHKRIEDNGLSKNFLGVLGNFKDLYELANKSSFIDVDGILLDLGYSSSQLLNDERGISYVEDASLDMRIDQNLGVTAADLVNSLPQPHLEQLFREYGEERLARRFSEAIVESRKLKKIETTKELSELIVASAPSGYDSGRTHPAMRVFQSLRIVVNDELENLKKALPQAARLLKLPDGKLVVISFHSLEDRIVKQFGQAGAQLINGAYGQNFNLEVLTKKPLIPSQLEISKNKRARSAKMRVFKRIS